MAVGATRAATAGAATAATAARLMVLMPGQCRYRGSDTAPPRNRLGRATPRRPGVGSGPAVIRIRISDPLPDRSRYHLHSLCFEQQVVEAGDAENLNCGQVLRDKP